MVISEKMGDHVAAAVDDFKMLVEIPSVSSAEMVRSSVKERKCKSYTLFDR